MPVPVRVQTGRPAAGDDSGAGKGVNGGRKLGILRILNASEDVSNLGAFPIRLLHTDTKDLDLSRPARAPVSWDCMVACSYAS